MINKEVQILSKISSIDKYGNITLNITTSELLSQGFSYGDEILILSDNGYMKKAQISSEYTLEEGSTIIKTGVASQPISASINYGNMAEEGSLTLGENIELKLLYGISTTT
jgi:S-adenosylmethionine hydrolase